MYHKVDLTGREFGRLMVIEKRMGRKWLCRCECGTVKEVYAQSLTTGVTKSCGCLQREICAKQSDARRAFEAGTFQVMKWGETEYVNFKRDADSPKETYRICKDHPHAVVLYQEFMGEPDMGCPLCMAEGELEVTYDVLSEEPDPFYSGIESAL